jgi:hypothetical protein
LVSHGRLIRIKARLECFGIIQLVIKREPAMPIDSILISAAVAAMFVAFAGVLMWGDRQTRSARPGPATGNTKRQRF